MLGKPKEKFIFFNYDQPVSFKRDYLLCDSESLVCFRSISPARLLTALQLAQGFCVGILRPGYYLISRIVCFIFRERGPRAKLRPSFGMLSLLLLKARNNAFCFLSISSHCQTKIQHGIEKID
ncbi:hypothetical protein BpHYR1_022991 [Brachionus plicatilis]|uniref:Uncharacterized protein n=1 Tax=Brachionus plicatilis TaxID=10195 RepID=A0A3M7QWY9_BRAPC|nr:hypothetical protein BpHYR1_022991 [Brachionus plicatilis]